jgi:hypothetical protein
MSTPILTATLVAHMLRKAGHKAVAFKSCKQRGGIGIVLIPGFKCTQARGRSRPTLRREAYGPVMVHCYTAVPAGPDAMQRHHAACLDLMAAYEKTLRVAGCHVLFHDDSFGMHLKVSV